MKRPSLTNSALASALAAATFALAGCVTNTVPAEKGELSDGTFNYQCVGSSDSFCDEGAVLPEGFPLVAWNSEFSASYQRSSSESSNDTAVDPVFIDAIAPERIGIVGDLDASPPTLKAFTPGFSAILAFDSDSAVDFLHVQVVPVDRLEIFRIGSGDNISGTLGMPDFTITGASSDKLRVLLKAKDGSLLAGSLPTAWSSTDPSVVAITSSPTDNYIHIETKSAGTATITVTVAELQVQFPITVKMP